MRVSPWFDGINWPSLWRRQEVEAGECQVFLELVTRTKGDNQLLEDEDVLIWSTEDVLQDSEGWNAGEFKGF